MIINYITSFRNIILNIYTQGRNLNSLQSDLNVLISEISSKIVKKLNADGSFNIDYHALIKSIEFNNALLISTIRPKNISYFLESALADGRYYFFSTVCDILINSNIKKELKEEIQSLLAEASLNINFPLRIKEEIILNKIVEISKNILEYTFTGADWRTNTLLLLESELNISLNKYSLNNPKLSEIILSELHRNFSKMKPMSWS